MNDSCVSVATQHSESEAMALEALSSNDLSSFNIYDTISAIPPFISHESSETSFLLQESNNRVELDHAPFDNYEIVETRKRQSGDQTIVARVQNLVGPQGKKKRRRKPRVCKNKEEAETQRMIHITVERNRRKQMNEHLAVLRSLMPESYVQRVCLKH